MWLWLKKEKKTKIYKKQILHCVERYWGKSMKFFCEVERSHPKEQILIVVAVIQIWKAMTFEQSQYQ